MGIDVAKYLRVYPYHVGVGKDEYDKGYNAALASINARAIWEDGAAWGIEASAQHMERLDPHGIGRYLGVLIRKLKNE